MATRDEQSQKIMAAAMRYVKSGNREELEAFGLGDLQKADYQLGDRDKDSGYRRAIADRIEELRKAESKEPTKILEVKPSLYGIKLDVDEGFKQLKEKLRKSKKSPK